jgi:hypothetical protein
MSPEKNKQYYEAHIHNLGGNENWATDQRNQQGEAALVMFLRTVKGYTDLDRLRYVENYTHSI